MPIRFQVDPDFYDHPKTTGMSDSAFSLWVRAGSFSAAKTTDGFVSEDVLVYTLRSSVEVAEELVGRGLWRRRKGGFQFHQWHVRNLTRERVEADRETDRERKRRERSGKKPKGSSSGGVTENAGDVSEDGATSGSSQLGTQVVRPDTDRTPTGIQPDSERNPPVSVSVSLSVSESVSVSGSGQPPERPSDRCPQHLDDDHPPPCRNCLEARLGAEAWDRNQIRANAAARTAEARARDDTRRQAIARCALCDDAGYVGRQLCTHDPDAAERAKRGSALARAALAGRGAQEAS